MPFPLSPDPVLTKAGGKGRNVLPNREQKSIENIDSAKAGRDRHCYR